MDPIVVIAFYKDAGGEYRLSYDAELNSVFYDRLGSNYRANMNSRTREYQQTSVSELAVTLDLGKVQQLPAQEEVFSEIITDKEYYNAIPIKAITDFHSRDEDGKTFASLTVAIKKKDIPSYAQGLFENSRTYIIARLISETDPDLLYNFPEGSFTPSPLNDAVGPDDILFYQARSSFAPGKYTLLIGVFDRASEFIGSRREAIVIREMPQKPVLLSNIILAQSIDQKEGGIRSRKGDPFWFGDLFVVPRTDKDIRKGEPLTIFFQVTRAADPDLAARQPGEKHDFSLKGSYQFYMKNEAGEFARIGKPIPFDIVEPYSPEPLVINKGRTFETANWPEGRFKCVVTVSDEKIDDADSQEVYFSIF